MDNSDQLSEDEIISKILNYTDFNDYYNTERKKIIKPIIWIYDTSLDPGLFARNTESKDRIDIRIMNKPNSQRDAFRIAHELDHSILHQMGYPGVFDFPGCVSITSGFNSVLQDFLVDSKLQEYGFDILSMYKEEKDTDIVLMKQEKGEPADPYNRFHWMTNIVDAFIYRDIVFKNRNTLFIEDYLKWINSHYFKIFYESKLLYLLFNDIGFDTPNKQEILIRKVIEKYHFENFFFTDELKLLEYLASQNNSSLTSVFG